MPVLEVAGVMDIQSTLEVDEHEVVELFCELLDVSVLGTSRRRGDE